MDCVKISEYTKNLLRDYQNTLAAVACLQEQHDFESYIWASEYETLITYALTVAYDQISEIHDNLVKEHEKEPMSFKEMLDEKEEQKQH